MMRNLLFLTVALLFCGPILPTALAADPETQKVLDLIEAARGKYKPVTEDDLVKARATLEQWVKHLDGQLARHGAAYAKGWKDYLLWDDLLAQLEKKFPSSAELLDPDQNVGQRYVGLTSMNRHLLDVWDRFRRNNDGLEAPHFTGTRDALRNYIDLLGSFEDLRLVMRARPDREKAPTPAEMYEQKLNDLAAAFEAFQRDKNAPKDPNLKDANGDPADRNTDNAVNVRKAVYWLARQRQAPELIAAVGAHFNQVNGEGQMSAVFMSKAVDQPVHQTAPIHDNILGTSIHGTGTMNGNLAMRPGSHQPNGQMNLTLTGLIHSKTTGYNGPVTIYSTGCTSVTSHKALFMTEHGLISLPAHACAKTNTNIDCIAARKRIVERIAWKRASASLPEAEAIAARKAEKKVAAGMDERAAEFVRDANSRYKEDLINPLIRGGVYPQLLAYASTPSHMHAFFTRAAGGQLAAFDRHPKEDFGGGKDLTVQFHEMLLMNMAESRLAGWTLTDVEAQRMREMGLKKEEIYNDRYCRFRKDQRWSLTFADEMPLRVTFGGDEVLITLQTKRFATGTSVDKDLEYKGDMPGPMKEDRSIYEPMQIKVRYRVVYDEQNQTVAYLERIDSEERRLRARVIDPLTGEPTQAGGTRQVLIRRLEQIMVGNELINRKPEDDPGAEPDEPATEEDDCKDDPVFKKYIEIEPIKLKGRMEKLGYLVLERIHGQYGWTSLSWRQVPVKPTLKDPPPRSGKSPEALPAPQGADAGNPQPQVAAAPPLPADDGEEK